MSAIKEAYDKLVEERKEITDQSQPIREQENIVLQKIRPLQAEYDKLIRGRQEIEAPLYELDMQIAALARMLPNHVKAPVINE